MPTALRPNVRPKLDLYDWVDQQTPTGLERELEHFYEMLDVANDLPIETVGNVLAWARSYRRIDGQPFSLDRHLPLLDLYQDDHPHIVAIKPAQKGVSELAVNVACYALEYGAAAWAPHKDGLNVGYIFPTAQALGDFSKERLSGLKDETEHLRDMFGGDRWDAITFKQVGRSYLYLRGGKSDDELRSFPCDVLILDEFDRMEARTVALARRRMAASEVKRELDISTPSLPGRGIHAAWLASDRRVYEQPCPHCEAWNRYDFHRDVRVDGEAWDTWQAWDERRIRVAAVYLACPSCGGRLTDADRCALGRWVAEAPEVTSLRGYWIPPLAFPFVDLTALAVAAVRQDPSELEEFYRSDLGIPYETKGGKVTEAMLKALSAELPGGLLPAGPWRQMTMGVDVGSRFHYRISGLDPEGVVNALAMGSVGSWAELDDLVARYRVRSCVVDALPEQHGAEEWAAKHDGRVWRALYPTAAAMAGELFREKKGEQLVQVNRTAAMDAVYASLAGGQERWPADLCNDPEAVAHLTAPVRVVSEDGHGQPRAEWVHTAPDDLFHACVYDLIARRRMDAPLEGLAPVGLDSKSAWRL